MPIMPFLRSPSILLLYRVLLFPGYKFSSLTCHAMGKMIIYRTHEELKKKSMYSIIYPQDTKFTKAPAQNAMYAITLYKTTCNDNLLHVHVKK